jgi:hypothetical protein
MSGLALRILPLLVLPSLVLSSLVFPSLVFPWLSYTARAQTNANAPVANTAILQRMKWQDFVSGPDGDKRLASLQKAVAKMKSLDNSPVDSADFRRSWKYWANIHGYLGPNSPFKWIFRRTA